MTGPDRPINTYLAALIAEAGISHAGLARQVNQLGRRPEHGSLDLRYDSSSVNRWLRGAIPAAPTPTLIAAFLARRLARIVEPEQLVGGSDFLQLPPDAASAANAAISLWHQAAHLGAVLE